MSPVAPGGGPSRSVFAARRVIGAGALSCPSVTQTLPSRSTWMPCGKMSMPVAEALHQLARRVELQDRSAARRSRRLRDSGTCWRRTVRRPRSTCRRDRCLPRSSIPRSALRASSPSLRWCGTGLSWAASQAAEAMSRTVAREFVNIAGQCTTGPRFAELLVHLTMSATKPSIQAAEELEP